MAKRYDKMTLINYLIKAVDKRNESFFVDLLTP